MICSVYLWNQHVFWNCIKDLYNSKTDKMQAKYCIHFSGKHSIKGVLGSCVPDMWSGRTTGTGPF